MLLTSHGPNFSRILASLNIALQATRFIMKVSRSFTFIFALFVTACGGSGSNTDDAPSSFPPVTVTASPTPTSVSSPTPSISPTLTPVVAEPSPSVTPEPTDDPLAVSVDSLHSLASGFPIGAAVKSRRKSADLITTDSAVGRARRENVKQHYNQLTAENAFKMKHTQPQEGVFVWDPSTSQDPLSVPPNFIEELVSFAEENGMSFHMHALVWHTQTPDWLVEKYGDNDSADVWEALMTDHITEVVCHFAGRMASWDVVNEAFAEYAGRKGVYRDQIWYQKIGASYIEKAFIAADAARKNPECTSSDNVGDLYYNDYDIAADYYKRQSVKDMVADFKARNIPIDGIGLQMHVNPLYDQFATANLREGIRDIVTTGLKIKITEMDVDMSGPGNTVFTDEEALRQKQIYQEVITAYMEEVPPAQRGGISFWGTDDGESWLNSRRASPPWPLLFDENFIEKPALQGVADGLLATFQGDS